MDRRHTTKVNLGDIDEVCSGLRRVSHLEGPDVVGELEMVVEGKKERSLFFKSAPKSLKEKSAYIV